MKVPEGSPRVTVSGQRTGARNVLSASPQGAVSLAGGTQVRNTTLTSREPTHPPGGGGTSKVGSRFGRAGPPSPPLLQPSRSNGAGSSSSSAVADAQVAVGDLSASRSRATDQASILSPNHRHSLRSAVSAAAEAPVSEARAAESSTSSSPATARKTAEEDLRQRIRHLAQRGSTLASSGDAAKQRRTPVLRCTSPPLQPPSLATPLTQQPMPAAPACEVASPVACQPSVNSTAAAATARPSSPGRSSHGIRSPRSPGDQSLHAQPSGALAERGSPGEQSLQGQLDSKARQMVELRAQISRWELGGGACPSESSYTAEPSYPEPERTGPRSPASSVGVASKAMPLEEELAWTVKQMESHRRQIQEHQRHLCALERRHAELVAIMSSASRESSVSAFSPGADRTFDAALDSQSLCGGNSPTSSIQDSRLGLLQSEQPNTADDRETFRADALLSSQKSNGWTSSVNAEALAAAQARLGLKVFSSRPTSAGSTRSANSAAAPSYTRNSCMQKNPRPGSVGSSASSATLPGRTVPSWDPPPSGESVERSRSTNFGVNGGETLSPGSRSAIDDERFGLRPRAASGSAVACDGDPALEDTLQMRQRHQADDVSEPADPNDTAQEAAVIAQMLKQFSARRPLRVAFVPLATPVDGDGQPYLHGSLEVRLFLSSDSKKLQVRVPTTSGTAGRAMDIDDFVTRAETIAARRLSRPNPIAEEAEQSPTLTSPPRDLSGDGSPTLQALLGPKVASPSGTPWKSLFKSHWDSK